MTNTKTGDPTADKAAAAQKAEDAKTPRGRKPAIHIPVTATTAPIAKVATRTESVSSVPLAAIARRTAGHA